MMRIWWVWLLLSMSAVFCSDEDFTVKRPVAASHSRQQLRELFAELLNDYLELLIEELVLTSQRLLCDKAMSDTEVARAHKHIKNLSNLRIFLCTGNISCPTFSQSKLSICDSAIYVHIIEDIGCTQKAIIKVLRALLERDTTSCFVSCKTKAQLERYINNMRSYIDDTHMYIQRLEVFVRANEKINN